MKMRVEGGGGGREREVVQRAKTLCLKLSFLIKLIYSTASDRFSKALATLL